MGYLCKVVFLLQIFCGIQMNGYHFAFVMLQNDMTWNDAIDNCRANGKELITIRDRLEQTAIINFITAQTPLSPTYWVGLKYNGGPGELNENFCWYTDNTCLSTWSNWRENSSEPDHLNDHLKQHCVIMMETHGYQWGSKQCDFNYKAICESDGLVHKFKKVSHVPGSNSQSQFESTQEEFSTVNVIARLPADASVHCAIECHNTFHCDSFTFTQHSLVSCILLRA